MNSISFKNVSKSFGDLEILKDICFDLEERTSVAVIGKSGCGKSTFLHLAGGLDVPTSGEVFCNGNSWNVNDKTASNMRNSDIGFIFQSNFLLEDFSVLDNVIMPALIKGSNKEDAKQKAIALLKRLGLEDKLNQQASKLSGGEKQRIAICRALINSPKVVLADEPTGALDEENSLEVEELLLDLVKEKGCSLLLVTHNNEFANMCDKVYLLTQKKLTKVK